MILDDLHESRVEPSLLRACQIWATAAEGGWSASAAGLQAMGSAAGQRAFNQAFITTPTPDIEALRELTSRYENGPYRLRFRDDLHDSAMPAVEALHLERQGGIPTMTMVLSGGFDGPNTDLRIERVSDEATLNDHVRVVAEGFGNWIPDTLGRIFTAKLLDEPAWAGWVGYEGSVAVASSQLVVHGDVAGLYYIATLETARRKGYGEALTRAAIREGLARGCDLACLQASPFGRPVYERLGFNVIGEYITYVPKD